VAPATAHPIAWALAVLLAAAALTFFVVLPPIVDDRYNDVEPVAYAATERGQALHEKLLVVDLHADPMLWDRNLLKRTSRGHVDLPRLSDGNVALQVFSAVTKSPWGQNLESNAGSSDRLIPLVIAHAWPPRTWFDIHERALYQAERLRRTAEESGGRLVLVSTRAELDSLIVSKLRGDVVVGALLAMEGLHDLQNNPMRLRELVDAGYRMMAFTHFFDNDLAGSAHGTRKGGLTVFGRQVVELMDSYGVVMDLAHVSEQSMDEILDMVSRPVVVSHTGARGTCSSARNLSDQIIRRVAATGGVIGIGYWETAICGLSPRDIAATARYTADLVGVDHVAIGSDFDGSVVTGLDASQHALVTSALLDFGFEEKEVAKIMGLNALRVLRRVLPE